MREHLPVRRMRSRSVVTTQKIIVNFGHDRRSNLKEKVSQIKKLKRSKSVQDPPMTGHDVSFSVSNNSVSEEDFDDLQQKVKDLELIRTSQQKSRQEFESLLSQMSPASKQREQDQLEPVNQEVSNRIDQQAMARRRQDSAHASSAF